MYIIETFNLSNMLTIQNIDKIIGKGFVTDVNTIRKHWFVNKVNELSGVYDITIQRKVSIFEDEILTILILRQKNELDMYSIQIIKEGNIIDRDNIRTKNLQTRDSMLMELKVIIEMMQ